MKILITGHKGFIGSYLWKMIEESGVDVELDGIEKKRNPGKPINVNMYEEAIKELGLD